jgi:hypothetical protein
VLTVQSLVVGADKRIGAVRSRHRCTEARDHESR